MHTGIHTALHTCTRAYTPLCIHAHGHTCTRAYTLLCIHAHGHTLCSAYMHMGIHKHTLTFAHSHNPEPWRRTKFTAHTQLLESKGSLPPIPSRIPRPNPDNTTHRQGHRPVQVPLSNLRLPSHPEPKYDKTRSRVGGKSGKKQEQAMETTPTQASAPSMGTPRKQSSTTRYTWHLDAHKRAVGPLLLSHRPSEPLRGAEGELASSNFPLLSEQEWRKGPCTP